MKRILYLPIEIIERELDSKLLLAAEALSRGYRVYIGHYRRIEAAAFSQKGGFYLYKAMTDYNGEKLFAPLQDAGVITMALDEEGLVWPSLKYYSDTRIGKGVGLRFLDLIFTWGDEQREYIAQKYDVPGDKIISVGNPRFDTIRKPYRKIYQKEACKIKKRYSRFVLVNTNFGPANFSHVFGRTWLEHLQWTNIITSNDDINYYKERESYYRLMMDSYTDALHRLSKAISPVKIIVRPHPSEEHSTWVERLKDCPSVHVVFEASSKPWLISAECVVHSGCTTGIEGFVLGKHVVRYNVTGRDDMESPLPNIVSDFCSTYDELENKIIKILIETVEPPNKKSKCDFLNCRLKNITGKHAYIAILDEIERKFDFLNLPPNPRLKGDGPMSIFFQSVSLRGLESIVLKTPYINQLPFLRKRRLNRQRFSGITRSQLLVRLGDIINAVGFNAGSNVQIKKFSKDVYILDTD